MAEKRALAVMLKAPETGKVKTRLVPPLTPSQATMLYTLFIKETFGKVTAIEWADIFAAYTPSTAFGRLKGILPRIAGSFPQKGSTLGERIHGVFAQLFRMGYGRACVIGSDSPDLPLEFIEEAFNLLDGGSAELVLGPAKDGGYYLIAMKMTGPVKKALFTGISWSTRGVLHETIRKARLNSVSLRLLKPWHDIDTGGDLRLLRNNSGAPLSSAFLSSIGLVP